MTSFAKACMDLSNNLRNFRLNSNSSSNNKPNNLVQSKTNSSTLTRSDFNSDQHHLTTNHSDSSVTATSNSNEQTNKSERLLLSRSPILHRKLARQKSTSGQTDQQSTTVTTTTTQSHVDATPVINPKPANHKGVNRSHTTYAGSFNQNAHQPSISQTMQSASSNLPYSTYSPQMANKPHYTIPNSDSHSSHTTAISAATTVVVPTRRAPSQISTSSSFRITPSNNNNNNHNNNSNTNRPTPKVICSPILAHRIAHFTRVANYDYGDCGSGSNQYRPSSARGSGSNSACSSPIMPHRGNTVAIIKQRLLNQGLQIDVDLPVKKYLSTRYRDCFRRLQRGRPFLLEELWKDKTLLTQIFSHLSTRSLLNACLTCRVWFELINETNLLDKLVLSINVRELVDEVELKLPPEVSARGNNEDIAVSENELSANQDKIKQHLNVSVKKRIDAALRRHIRSLCFVQLSQQYVQCVHSSINTCLKSRIPETNVEGHIVRNSSSFRAENGSFPVKKNQSNAVYSPLINDAEQKEDSKQPLSPIQNSTHLSSSHIAHQSDENCSISKCSKLSHYFQSFKPTTTRCQNELKGTDTTYSPFGHPRSRQHEMLDENLKTQEQFDDRLSPTVQSHEMDHEDEEDASEGGEVRVDHFDRLIMRHCSILDSGLEMITQLFPRLTALELHCCNELSEMTFWTCLNPNIRELRVFDCINVSDESIGAITQLLPKLRHLSLQAYHVTDSAFACFTPSQRMNLETMRLIHCMEMSNQGVMNLAYSLANLRHLSLVGCSNLTDDGLDVVCENLKQLKTLDLSWCCKISDSGLECVACDLHHLCKLNLDRCTSITDLGLGHLTSMPNLRQLCLRWCANITDGAIAHLLGMTRIRQLSLAGCKRLTEDGICQLARHPRLRCVELTNCSGATARVKLYLRENLAGCKLIG